MNIRVGFGYDVHKLVENRDLWLGGIQIDSNSDYWATVMQMC